MTPDQTKAWQRRIGKVLKAPVTITYEPAESRYRFAAEGYPAPVFMSADTMSVWAKINGAQLTKVAHRIAQEFRR